MECIYKLNTDFSLYIVVMRLMSIQLHYVILTILFCILNYMSFEILGKTSYGE